MDPSRYRYAGEQDADRPSDDEDEAGLLLAESGDQGDDDGEGEEHIPWADLDTLVRGSVLLKWGKRGEPHFRLCRLTLFATSPTEPPLSCLEWLTHKKTSEKSRIALTPLLSTSGTLEPRCQLLLGQQTPVFRRQPRPDLEGLSFSLVPSASAASKGRTLDLVCKDRRELEQWTRALLYLTTRGPPPLPLIEQRKKTIWLDLVLASPAGSAAPDSASGSASGGAATGRSSIVNSIFGGGGGRVGASSSSSSSSTASSSTSAAAASSAASGGAAARLGGSLRRVNLNLSRDLKWRAMREKNDVFSWGKGEWGQTGLGLPSSITAFNTSAATAASGVSNVAASPSVGDGVAGTGSGAMVATAADGSVGGSGGGDHHHQQQQQQPFITPLPTLLPSLLGRAIRTVACGPQHCLALGESGECYAWGHGGSGRLGTGACDHEQTPRLLLRPATETTGREPYRFRSVACGDLHSVAIGLLGGEPYSWGCNNNGQLGLGVRRGLDVLLPTRIPFFVTAVPSPAPTSGSAFALWISSPSFLQVAAGSGFSCFVDTTGKAYSCGGGDGGSGMAPLGHDWTFVTKMVLSQPAQSHGKQKRFEIRCSDSVAASIVRTVFPLLAASASASASASADEQPPLEVLLSSSHPSAAFLLPAFLPATQPPQDEAIEEPLPLLPSSRGGIGSSRSFSSSSRSVVFAARGQLASARSALSSSSSIQQLLWRQGASGRNLLTSVNSGSSTDAFAASSKRKKEARPSGQGGNDNAGAKQEGAEEAEEREEEDDEDEDDEDEEEEREEALDSFPSAADLDLAEQQAEAANGNNDDDGAATAPTIGSLLADSLLATATARANNTTTGTTTTSSALFDLPFPLQIFFNEPSDAYAQQQQQHCISLSCGPNHVAAVTSPSGSLYTWSGLSTGGTFTVASTGCLGHGDFLPRGVPTRVPAFGAGAGTGAGTGAASEAVIAAACGACHTVVLTEDRATGRRRVYGFGSVVSGQVPAEAIQLATSTTTNNTGGDQLTSPSHAGNVSALATVPADALPSDPLLLAAPLDAAAYCASPRLIHLPLPVAAATANVPVATASASASASGPTADMPVVDPAAAAASLWRRQPQPISVSAGGFNSAVIMEDGSLFMLGDGRSGALGITAGSHLQESWKRVKKAKTDAANAAAAAVAAAAAASAAAAMAAAGGEGGLATNSGRGIVRFRSFAAPSPAAAPAAMSPPAPSVTDPLLQAEASAGGDIALAASAAVAAAAISSSAGARKHSFAGAFPSATPSPLLSAASPSAALVPLPLSKADNTSNNASSATSCPKIGDIIGGGNGHKHKRHHGKGARNVGGNNNSSSSSSDSDDDNDEENGDAAFARDEAFLLSLLASEGKQQQQRGGIGGAGEQLPEDVSLLIRSLPRSLLLGQTSASTEQLTDKQRLGPATTNVAAGAADTAATAAVTTASPSSSSSSHPPPLPLPSEYSLEIRRPPSPSPVPDYAWRQDQKTGKARPVVGTAVPAGATGEAAWVDAAGTADSASGGEASGGLVSGLLGGFQGSSSSSSAAAAAASRAAHANSASFLPDPVTRPLDFLVAAVGGGASAASAPAGATASSSSLSSSGPSATAGVSSSSSSSPSKTAGPAGAGPSRSPPHGHNERPLASASAAAGGIAADQQLAAASSFPLSSTLPYGPLPVTALAKKEVRSVAFGLGFCIATVATEWMLNSEVSACVRCQQPFNSLFLRKHHCRCCGGLVCQPCSFYRLPLLRLGFVQPVRVCVSCYHRLADADE